MMATNPTGWLVTGGAGFIGSHLVRALLDRAPGGGLPPFVRVLDDFSTGLRERLVPFEGRVEVMEGSITDPETCRRACRGVSHVLHQAAIPSVQRSVEDPRATHEACATGTLNLLGAARETGVQRVVYAGSSSAYGDTPVLPKHESMPSNPRSPYAVAKLAGEQYVRTFWDVYGLEGVVLRYFNVFGPGQDPSSHYAAVVPKFLTMALGGQAPVIYGDGRQTRDFTYIENVVEANLRVALAPSGRVSGRVFNVGCGDRVSVNMLWAQIRELAGVDLRPRFGPSRPGDVRDSLADVSALSEATGWMPRVDLREGLRRTMESFRTVGDVVAG